MLTRPLLLEGDALRLNYATSAAGSLRVEIQDESGQPLSGYALEEMDPIYGDQLDAPVAWKAGGDLSDLKGRSVRLRVVLQDTDLFAVRAA